jgi:hypothetical protein
MVFNPKDEPCSECGREVEECVCPSDLDEHFDPLSELTGYDPDWDDYETGDLIDDNDEEPSALG